MQQIIIGTRNKAKIAQIKGALAPLQISIQGLPNNINLPDVAEDGKTAQKNAKKKAVAFAKALGQPLLSTDHALYFNDLSKNKQPGLNVRRINGRTDRPTDEEMLQYYSHLVRKLGDNAKAYWEFAYCFAFPDGKVFETTIKSPRVFTSKISPKRIEGYPLESIQIDPASGKYIAEMSQDEQDAFWQNAIREKLCRFIKNII